MEVTVSLVTKPVTASVTQDVISGSPSPAWDPLQLPALAIWLDASDLSTMWQETTGSPPATPAVVNGVVGTILDKSSNAVYLRAPSDAARPILRQSGAFFYLEFDGVDDKLEEPTISLTQPNTHAFAGFASNTFSDIIRSIGGNLQAVQAADATHLRHFAGAANVDYAGRNNSAPQTVINLFNLASSYVRFDGTQVAASTSPGSNVSTGLQVGAGLSFSAAQIYQVVSTDAEITGDDLANLEAFLDGKRGA